MTNRARGAALAAAFGIVFLAVDFSPASNWPRFRGPNGSGNIDDKDVPVRWDAKDGILWKTPLPGNGNSSPVVWENRVFVQSATADAKERSMICVDADRGQVLWSRPIPGGKGQTHPKNSLASSTPATDGERLFGVFWDGKEVFLYAFDFKGHLLWHRELGQFKSQHGPGFSPIVYRDHVIVSVDSDESSAVLAFDAASGNSKWRTPRKGNLCSYSTPLVLERPGEKPELIVCNSAGVSSLDLEGGEENWAWDWPVDDKPMRTVASPVLADDLLVASSGNGGGGRLTTALQLPAKGSKEKPQALWQGKKTFPYVPSFLARGDYLYFVSDRDFAGCCKARTGEMVWTHRLGGDVSASPIMIDGKIYAFAEDGHAYVFAAEPEFKLLAKNSVDERVIATPAAANHRLYVRGKSNLICIGSAAKAP